MSNPNLIIRYNYYTTHLDSVWKLEGGFMTNRAINPQLLGIDSIRSAPKRRPLAPGWMGRGRAVRGVYGTPPIQSRITLPELPERITAKASSN
jgi:hypothetical protein